MNDVRDININHLRRKIEETVDPEDQKREKEFILPHVRMAVKLLTAELDALVADFRRNFHLRTLKETDKNPFTIRVERTWAQIGYMSAGATMIQDSLISGSLAQSWLNFSPITAIVIGALAGMILSLGWKFGVGLFARAYTREEPRSARRKLQAITAVAFAVNFVLVLVVLSTRNPSESWVEFLANMNTFALTLMGIALPILAGALLALAQDLDWSHGDSVDFRRLTMRLAELNGFLGWCGDLQADEAAGEGTHGREPELTV
jgi:hypothetical protein